LCTEEEYVSLGYSHNLLLHCSFSFVSGEYYEDLKCVCGEISLLPVIW